MAKTSMIRARIEPHLKEEAEDIIHKLGLSVTQVLTLLYKQITMREGLPFDVKIPNQQTIKAIRETHAGRSLIKSDLDELRRNFE